MTVKWKRILQLHLSLRGPRPCHVGSCSRLLGLRPEVWDGGRAFSTQAALLSEQLAPVFVVSCYLT